MINDNFWAYSFYNLVKHNPLKWKESKFLNIKSFHRPSWFGKVTKWNFTYLYLYHLFKVQVPYSLSWQTKLKLLGFSLSLLIQHCCCIPVPHPSVMYSLSFLPCRQESFISTFSSNLMSPTETAWNFRLKSSFAGNTKHVLLPFYVFPFLLITCS